MLTCRPPNRLTMRAPQVFKTPEVCRVYIGSFNADAPINK